MTKMMTSAAIDHTKDYSIPFHLSMDNDKTENSEKKNNPKKQTNKSSSPSDPVEKNDLPSTAVPTTAPLLGSSTQPFTFSRLLFCLTVGLVVTYFFRSFIHALDDELSLVLSNRSHSNKKVEGFEKELQKLHLSISTLADVATDDTQEEEEEEEEAGGGNYSASVLSLRAKHNGQNVDTANQVYSKYNVLRHKVEELSENAHSLKTQIQDSSRRQVQKKYGEGKHLVEIELAFPDAPSHDNEDKDKFVVELAPLDAMPHSVHVFLDMVSAGLLDGCSFILNALHILKAAPLPYDGSPATEKAMAFLKLGLESVSFKEYNETFPHKPYTLGFTADGSPGFYINTEDNTDTYVGDPCFGKIVSGFATVRRMEESPTRNGIWLEKRIGIKHARIL